MKIDGVTSTNTSTKQKKQPLISVKNTGYVAVAGMAITMIGGVTKNKFLMRSHKVFAGISFAAAIAHIALVMGKFKSKGQAEANKQAPDALKTIA